MTTHADRPRERTFGLSARLLVLTVIFVMIAEFLIYTPSIARFRKAYLEDLIARARLATLALEVNADIEVTTQLQQALLADLGAHGIMLAGAGRRMLAVSKDMPPAVDVTFDARETGWYPLIREAFGALAQDRNRIMRVLGASPRDPGLTIEVVADEAPMIREMYAYSARILQLSIVISLLTASLVYFSLQWLLVRPMRRLTVAMTGFREDPEDERRLMLPSARTDEVGVAERELADLQRQVRAALRQKTRLATLGAAVAKVNHDLRNTLATAMLVSDRLVDSEDPEVQKVAPRLYDAIDRAVQLCSQTLTFVSESGPSLRRARFSLRPLIDEVGETVLAGLPPAVDRAWRNQVAEELTLVADHEQLFRLLVNLGRNAFEAGARAVGVTGACRDGQFILEIADDGPGLSSRARRHLFQPFAGSGRDGGTGLGLVIAQDIARAHGGEIALRHSDAQGTVFAVTLPAGGA